MGIQEEAKRLAPDVRERDGWGCSLRVGLNAGQVIAGEIGSGPFGYTAVGKHVAAISRGWSTALVNAVRARQMRPRMGETGVPIAVTANRFPAPRYMSRATDRYVRMAMLACKRERVRRTGAKQSGPPDLGFRLRPLSGYNAWDDRVPPCRIDCGGHSATPTWGSAGRRTLNPNDWRRRPPKPGDRTPRTSSRTTTCPTSSSASGKT